PLLGVDPRRQRRLRARPVGVLVLALVGERPAVLVRGERRPLGLAVLAGVVLDDLGRRRRGLERAVGADRRRPLLAELLPVDDRLLLARPGQLALAVGDGEPGLLVRRFGDLAAEIRVLRHRRRRPLERQLGPVERRAARARLVLVVADLLLARLAD